MLAYMYKNFPILFMLAHRFFEHQLDFVARELLFEILHRILCEFIDDPLVDRFKHFHVLFVQSDVQIHFRVCLGVT